MRARTIAIVASMIATMAICVVVSQHLSFASTRNKLRQQSDFYMGLYFREKHNGTARKWRNRYFAGT